MATAKEKEEMQKAASADRRALSLRHKQQAMENGMIRKGAVVTTAGVFGVMNRMGISITMGGVPTKVIIAGGGLIGEGFTKGRWQAFFGGVADAALATYMERSISTDSMIAGDVDDDDPEV